MILTPWSLKLVCAHPLPLLACAVVFIFCHCRVEVRILVFCPSCLSRQSEMQDCWSSLSEDTQVGGKRIQLVAWNSAEINSWVKNATNRQEARQFSLILSFFPFSSIDFTPRRLVRVDGLCVLEALASFSSLLDGLSVVTQVARMLLGLRLSPVRRTTSSSGNFIKRARE